MFAYLSGPTNPVNRADIFRGTEMPTEAPGRLQSHQTELSQLFETYGALLLETLGTLPLHVWKPAASKSVKSVKIEPLQ